MLTGPTARNITAVNAKVRTATTLWKILACLLAAYALYAQAISDWAFGGPDHRLHYRIDERGNGIMDFSFAGYRSGGVALPSVAVCQRLTPAAGDSTARIQAALDKAAGAIVLAPGEYDIAGTLSITHSGVVLRGEKGAVVRLTGQPHRFLEIHGEGAWREEGPRSPILDSYVPAGSTSFRVHGASTFHAGDPVLVLRPPGPTALIRTDRVVDSVNRETITLDAPLSDALDSRSAPASLVRYSFPGRINEVGVEGLRIITPFGGLPAVQPQYSALRMDAVEDGWARDLDIQETLNGVAIGPGAKRLTITNIRITHSAYAGSPAPADFTLHGTQILLDRCRVIGESASPVATQPEATGPLVILNFTADHGGVTSDSPWTAGVLIDGGKFPGATQSAPGVSFSNRVGWSVAWNVTSPFVLVQQPQGAMNWCIGCNGSPVHPLSLYLQQLRDRLGPDAVRSIGYADALSKLL